MRKLAVALALASLAVPAATASAAPPCWQRLLVDSYDFRIDHTYPAGCYVTAMKHVPRDLADYSDLLDVLRRALAAVEAAHPGARTAAAIAALPIPPTEKLPKFAQPRAATKAPLSVVAADVSPGGPTTLPVPLLVLGGLGALLTAAGGVGALLRRRRRGGA